MKLTLLQFICFSFILGYVGADALGGNHADKLCAGILLAFVIGYLNNFHGKTWARVKSVLSKA